MLGTWVNVGTILLGSALGLLLRRGIPPRLRDTVMQGLGLCVLLIGLSGALGTQDTLCVILSMVAGGLLGAGLRLEERLDRLGALAQRKLARGSDGFAKGFVSASLMFCVGAMAVMGSLDSGLKGDYSTLLAKAALDGVSSVIFASALGPGVALAALPVLLYQGGITLAAGYLKPLLTDPIVTEMSAVGGLLIVGIGLNMLYDKRLAVGNLLPAVFIPLAYYPLAALLGAG